jgi:hypothetical protein
MLPIALLITGNQSTPIETGQPGRNNGVYKPNRASLRYTSQSFLSPIQHTLTTSQISNGMLIATYNKHCPLTHLHHLLPHPNHYILTTMIVVPFAAILAPMTSGITPSCGRRGVFDWKSPIAATALLRPAVQMDVIQCANECLSTPACGGFASTGKKLPTDWCFVFKAGL